jgi:hypothetical protein
MSYQCFVVLALLMPARWSIAQAAPSPASIRRTAPAEFRGLPVTIRSDLERRRCFIPQPYDAHAASNVIHGAFTAAKVSEWAILCSVRDTSQILIYRFPASACAGVIDSLERAADIGWMQAIGNGRWGYSRLLRTLALRQMRAWKRHVDEHTTSVSIDTPASIDHDAIEQLFLEKSSEALYYAAGRVHRMLRTD